MASCNDTLYQAGSIWRFLDKLALTNPEEYKQYIEKVMKEGEELNFGPPVAKFVVETYKTPKVIPMRKFFINIGEWKQVPKVESKDDPIPVLSAKPRKELVDKEWAMVVDIVLNPDIFNECHSNFEKCAVVELVFKHIEQKNGFSLSRKYKFLEERYKGNQDNLLNFMCPTSLQKSLKEANESNLTRETVLDKMKCISGQSSPYVDEKKGESLIEEMQLPKMNCNEKVDKLSANDDRKVANVQPMDPVITANLLTPALTEEKSKTYKNIEKSKFKRPKVEMEVRKDEGTVELTVYLPDVDSVQECDLELTESHLSLNVSNKYELDLDLPVSINIDESKAKFVKDLKIMLITANLNLSPKV